MADQLTGLENRYQTLSNSLGSSSTAYAPNTTPTSRDISTDNQLASVNKQIEDLKSKQIRNKWYGPSDTAVPTEDTSSSSGWLMNGFKALQRPLNAIVGTAQYALGKGSQPDLVSNVNNAMKTGLTSGDILKQYGVSRGVQIPLGFALDIMFDPISWATMGTEALIPRAVAPLAKEGLKGVGLMARGVEEGGLMNALKATGVGITSNLEKKATKVMNFMPFTKKFANIAPVVDAMGIKTGPIRSALRTGAIKYNNVAEKLGAKAVAGAEKYDTLMGTTVLDDLNKTPFGFKAGAIGDKIESTINKIPSYNIFGKATPTGEQIVNFFKYSPADASKISEQYDLVDQLTKNKNILLVDTKEGAHFIDVKDMFKPGATFTVENTVKQGIDSALEEATKVISVENTDRTIKVYNSLENAKDLINIAKEDANLKHITDYIDLPTLEKAYKTTETGKTGFAWYDNAISSLKDLKIGDLIPGSTKTIGELNDEAGNLVKTFNSYTGVRDIKPLEKILNGYQQFLAVFKPAKVMMNPGSHVVAWIGNFSMGAMMGIPVTKLSYIEEMIKARRLVNGKMTAEGFKEMFFNDLNHLIDLADNNPTVFRDVTGIEAAQISNKLKMEELLVGKFNERTSGSAINKYLQQKWDQIQGLEPKLSSYEGTINQGAKLESESKLFAKSSQEELGKFPLPSEQLASKLEQGPIKRSQEFTGITAGEITPNQNVLFNRFKVFVAEEAANAPAYRVDIKLGNALLNSMPAQYEHIDQIWKISTTSFLSKVGVSAADLKIISRTTPIDVTKDLLLGADGKVLTTIENGEKLYRTTPLYASRVATEAFMNYAAMPDFVKMMRAIPFGSPFVSFPYAMAIKTAKTAINNPALFNKVGFMINEMNVGRTPKEKAAMEETYNEYLKSPTTVKIMGMWNTDIKNMIPFYQMNMLNPSARHYKGDSFQTQMMKLSDQIPVMNDPIGGMIKDYWLQPWLLAGTGEVSQGSFGQPVVPNYDVNGKLINPSAGTKLLYGLRSIAESVTPGALSYLGIPIGLTGMSPEAINLVPSYGARNLANATKGRSSIGAMTKENQIQKTFRSLLGRTGIPAYTLDTTKTTSQP